MIYFHYVSGVINGFHQTKEAAEKAAELLNTQLSVQQRNGCKATVGVYTPGELSLINDIWCHKGKEVVHKDDVPWLCAQYWIIDDGFYFEIVSGEKPQVRCKVHGPFNSRQECLECIQLIDN